MARPFGETKAFDLLAASPFILFYGFAIAGIVERLLPRLGGRLDANGALDFVSQATTLVFLAVQITLFVFRQLPSAKSPGMLPRLAGVVGANLGVMFLALPRAEIPNWLSAASSLVTIAGTIGAIVSAAWLGRAFAIFPQARGLVVSGPYRYVRHPLYLFEQIATVGIMLQYRQPVGILLDIVVIAAQFPRMHFEEEILDETFPEYHAYRKSTARLIPGIY